MDLLIPPHRPVFTPSICAECGEKDLSLSGCVPGDPGKSCLHHYPSVYQLNQKHSDMLNLSYPMELGQLGLLRVII